MALPIPDHGLPSGERGGRPGDLFVVVRTAPDPHFERDGADLWHTETIPFADAVLGTRLDVPGLDGPATVEILAATQPNTTLRLRGRGLPRFGGTQQGDLYVRVHVRVPDHLSREERRLWEQLRARGWRVENA